MANNRRLEQYLSNYNNAPVTKNEINAVIAQYASLFFKQEKFVFNDGSSKDLVNLTGTIPIVYKNNTYNIPVCIWLMDTHPSNAPICYVRPTSDMGIRVSMHVDCNGKIYLPYLHEWTSSESELLVLIQIMIVTFGETPPVFKITRDSAFKVAYAMPPQHQGTTFPYPPNAVDLPNGYCPYPNGAAQTAGGGPQTGTNFPPYPMVATGAYPHPVPGQQPPSGSGAGVPYPIGAAVGMPGHGYNTDTNSITSEFMQASLVSAVGDKLRRRIQERVSQAQAEIETLQRVKQELQEGGSKIDERLARMEREQADMRANIVVLQDKKTAVEKAAADVAEKAGGGEFNVDEAVTTTAPLYKQLLNAYAEEAATEDTIYYMGEALRNGVIDLEVFLKHVRQLSRKQFMLRALMQKCRQTAGLAC